MSLTYLQLCNELAREAGVSGAAASISATANQTGMALRLVKWVKQAHTEIQNQSQFWRWMRSTWTVSMTSGVDTYAGTSCTDSRLSTAITRFARWIVYDDSGASDVKIYLTSGGVSGERWLTPIPWDYFTAIYRRGSQNNGPPVHVTVDPQNQLVVGPKPDATYTASGEYQMSALEFSADGDTPEFPSRFHDLVWLRALEKYARSQAAPEALARAEVEGGRLMQELRLDQLPRVALAPPLA